VVGQELNLTITVLCRFARVVPDIVTRRTRSTIGNEKTEPTAVGAGSG